MKKELNFEEMQSLVSDYSFCRLSKNESIIFEENLKNFPEIEKEVVEIRSIFSKVNKEKIKENLQNKTANYTYKIKQKQYKKGKNKTARNNIIKFVLPVLILGIVFIFLKEKNTEIKSTNVYPSDKTLISASDMDIILGNNDLDLRVKENASDTSLLFTQFSLINHSANINIYSYLNEMSETEFNQLLNEIENENFNI